MISKVSSDLPATSVRLSTVAPGTLGEVLPRCEIEQENLIFETS
jgi:hypothetical protein